MSLFWTLMTNGCRETAAQVDYLDIHPEMGVIYTNGYFINERGETIGGYLKNYTAYRDDVFLHLVTTNFITTSAVLVRRKCLLKVGGFDPKLKRAQDYDLWLRLAVSYKFGFISGCYYKYRSLSDDKIKHDTLLGSVWALEKLRKNYPQKFTRLEKHFALTCRQLLPGIGHVELKIRQRSSSHSFFFKKRLNISPPQSLPKKPWRLATTCTEK